jgi:NADH:ubiquinone reductase (H+-translocating)
MVKIFAVEAAPSIIPFFPKESIHYSLEVLKKHNIEVMTGKKFLNVLLKKSFLKMMWKFQQEH